MKRTTLDGKGAMEGIPLQLIIVVVIGVAALGILVGWLALAGDPDPTMKKVSVSPETVTVSGTDRASKEITFTVYVYDTKDQEVDQVVVTLSGSVDKTVTQVINSGGTVKVVAALPAGDNTGIIHIRAEKGGGMGARETTVVVMRG